MRVPPCTAVAALAACLAAPCAGPAHAAWPADPAVNVALCTAPSGQQFPVAVSDGAGGAIVAWWDFRGGANFDLYATRVLADGTPDPAWPANGVALCTASGDQQYPAIAPDGSGGAIVFWCDARGGLFDLYATRVLAGGAVDPAWPSNGLAVCALPGGQWFPAAIADGAGGAIVAWSDTRAGASDVYAQRVLGSGAVAPGWPAGGVALCTAPGAQDEVQLAGDGAGGAIVAWSDARGGVNFDVYARRVLASGAPDPAWPADGRALCAAPGNQLHPRLASDGAGGAIAVWQDARSWTEYDLYAQRVLANGEPDPAWPADGLAVCAAPLNQTEPRIVADGAGGAVVAWTDDRNGAHSDIYSARLLGSGARAPGWPADGLVLCAAPEFQHSPDLVADGAGGAVVVWSDSRGGASHDVYAQHALGSGAADPAWPAGGRAVSTAPGEQQNVVLVAGPAPIAVWDDTRSGNYDVYAQAATPPASAGPAAPAITAIADVKPDQGGFVTVAWSASALDAAPAFGIAAYRVWRSAAGSDWEPVAAAAAEAKAEYSLVTPTTRDSCASGTNVQRFRVEAIPAGPAAEGWSSAPDSAWSVDDLAPAAPQGFAGAFLGSGTALGWLPGPEPDLAAYRIYRGLTDTFEPSASNLLAEVTENEYTDPVATAYAYKLSAVDVNGNESPHALVRRGIAGAAAPAPRDFLAPAGALPARGAVALRFGLAAAGRASLAVYDPAGRRVRTLVDASLPAGEHAAAWDGRDESGRAAPAGFYFARLESAGASRTLRFVRLP